jgi:hypothetical protein
MTCWWSIIANKHQQPIDRRCPHKHSHGQGKRRLQPQIPWVIV